MLSTAFALIAIVAAALAVAAAWKAGGCAADAADAERALVSATRALKHADDRLLALESRLDRLAGRVYAQARKPTVNEQVRADILDDARADGPGVDPDPELTELLRLQSAPAASPGRPNGK